MTQRSTDTREDRALRELRTALEELGFQTKPSTGDNEFFTAFLYRDEYGNPDGGLFIVTSMGELFSWSRDGKHPIDDIPGAANEIQRIIREQGRPTQ